MTAFSLNLNAYFTLHSNYETFPIRMLITTDDMLNLKIYIKRNDKWFGYGGVNFYNRYFN